MSGPNLELLRTDIRALKSAALAFSGGVDSSLLAYVATQELGVSNFTAVTMNSPLLDAHDLEDAIRFCKVHGISHVVLDMDILTNDDFVANSKDRCYFCKQEIFARIRDYADAHNLTHVMDGTNGDDSPGRRPGMRVLCEKKIRSPLRECSFSKADIRAASKDLKLATWNKMSDSCLATRVPQGVTITPESLQQANNEPSNS